MSGGVGKAVFGAAEAILMPRVHFVVDRPTDPSYCFVLDSSLRRLGERAYGVEARRSMCTTLLTLARPAKLWFVFTFETSSAIGHCARIALRAAPCADRIEGVAVG